MKLIKSIINNLNLVWILILAIVLLSININKKFIGHHDWNSVVYSNIARNYIRYGYIATRFGQVENNDFIEAKDFGYLTHYPPLLPLFISLSFKAFGISEASARLVPIVASCFMLVFIFFIGKELFSRDTGFLAGLFTALTPIFIYFGKLPVHETVVPVFSLIVLYGYIKFYKTGNYKYYLLCVLALITGGLVNWSNFYIVPPVVIHYFLTKQKSSQRVKVLALLFICVFTFGSQILHIKILTGSFNGGLVSGFLFRANPYLTQDIYGFSLLKYIKQELQYFKIFFTLPLCLLSSVWLMHFVYKKIIHKTNSNDSFLIILLIYGLTCLIVFQNLAFIHDYMIYYLLPFIGLSSGTILWRMRIFLKKRFFIIILAISLYVSMERAAFAKAMLETDMNFKAWQISVFINRNLPSGKVAFVTSGSYKEFYEVFIRYYADRRVAYGETLDVSDINNYDMIIRPKAHDALNSEIKDYLDNRYKRHENEYFIWYFSEI